MKSRKDDYKRGREREREREREGGREGEREGEREREIMNRRVFVVQKNTLEQKASVQRSITLTS